MDYRCDILKAIVSVLRFRGPRELPFCRFNQTISSNLNRNYVGVLQLLSKFDSRNAVKNPYSCCKGSLQHF